MTADVRHEPPIACRLCGGEATFSFARRATDGNDVRYYRCAGCGSLETEEPHWLSATYAAGSEKDESADTFAVSRCLETSRAAYFIWKLGGHGRSDRLLDWGSGPGLLVRLLRDVWIDAYAHDKYVRNQFAAGFSASDDDLRPGRYAVVTAIEVFEHFASPADDLARLFALEPTSLLVSTSTYEGQGPDWTYLLPPEHVFFYAPDAYRRIGERFGYRVVRFDNGMTLFTRKRWSAIRLWLVQTLIGKRRWGEIAFSLKRRFSMAQRDQEAVRARG